MTRRPSIPVMTAMDTLSRLAGWQTVPHPDDHAVVRLAIITARARHNPDQGGRRAMVKLIDEIEQTWLDYAL